MKDNPSIQPQHLMDTSKEENDCDVLDPHVGEENDTDEGDEESPQESGM